jgi:uncharacterized protein
VRSAESLPENFAGEAGVSRHDACGGGCENVSRSGLGAAGQWSLLALVQLYRIFLSPFLGGACKFYPSCSQYAQEAIALHGAKRGSWLALKRLGRCRPFTKGGFDPVPDSRLGYERGLASAAKAPLSAAGSAGLKPCPSIPDYSDAEWLRSVGVNKELAQ